MKNLGCVALLVSAALGCSMSSVRAQSAAPKKDTQVWTDVQFIIPLDKKAEFFFQGTLRLGDKVTMPVDERWGAGFNYKLNKYVTLNELYFHREGQTAHARSEHEERLSFGATLNFPAGKFTIVNREWFERRWREPQVDAWRYRGRVQLEHPFKLAKRKFTWFVSDEVFYDWSTHGWVRNRAALGATHAFNKHVTGELYYMRQNDGRSRPGDLNILGSRVRLRL
jgi:hypothetical protein